MNKFCVQKHLYLQTSKTHSIEYLYFDHNELTNFINNSCSKWNCILEGDYITNYNEGYKYLIKGYKEFIKQEIRKNRLNDILDDKK